MSIRGTAGYNLGGQNSFGGGPSMGGIDQQNEPGALDAIREQTSKIEDFLDTLSDPVKPYLPAIGRFLIVVTFLEDALRIITQWSDQLLYLHDYRHIPNGLTHLFLIVNVIAMFSCSSLVIARRYSDYAVGGLIGVVVVQAVGYGLIFDLNFFLRNLSVMGGLLMVLSDSWVRKSKAFAGLPEIDEKDRKMYFQLAGRVLFDLPLHWIRFQWNLECLESNCCTFRSRCLRHGCRRFQGKVQCNHACSHLECFQRIGEQLLDSSRTPPPQGFRKIRFLPNSIYCWRSSPPCQQRTREIFDR
ncbi:hypothetical protein EYC84_010075 [Monilinia fructicola]|uniref:SURF4-domain-containing protein n=1 Tax=Monilinia fructicola TaxID=38448 RepID=A0A5M9JGP2_MONFR|nr:hypothetical protein EYC84_010075 [Monilinia fructicola]